MPGGNDSVVGLRGLVSRVAALARPGEQLEVYAARGSETDVRAFNGEIESLSSAQSAGLGIRVIMSGRQGFAYAGTIDEGVIARTLDEARDNATFATPDDHVGMAEPDRVEPTTIDLWDDGLGALAPEAKVEMALALERRVRHGHPRIRQVSSADYGDLSTEWAVATSTGIASGGRRTMCSLSVSAIAGDGDDSQTGTGFTAARGPEALDMEFAATEAIDRATRLLGAVKARSRRCVVVFDPRVTATLLGVISGALSGEAVTKGRSFLAGRVGEVVAAPLLTIVDDPTDERAFGASVYDAEGLACRRNPLVEDGVLRGFVYDTTAANRAGLASTASAVRGGYATTPVAGCRAVVLAPGTMDAEAIMGTVGDGFYVQSVTGVHSGVNPISGDFSVGAEGLMFRGGTWAEPTREVTVASTLQKMLQSVLHIGSDLRWLPGVAAGQTIAIDDMTLSGT
jgi:PmbA protein